MRASFLNGAGAFGFTGDTLSRNLLAVTPSVAWEIDADQSLGAGYSYEYGFSGTDAHRFDITYKVKF